MKEQYERTAMLLGEEAITKLNNAKVLIFGIGGVGGYVTEALARSGIGSFTLVDNDVVSTSNINRQIIATTKTVGRLKTEVMKERILDINPDAQVDIRNCFFLPENSYEIDFSDYTYVIDAIDTVTAKLEIICRAKECGVPVISSMGTGGKLDPSALTVTDVYKTSACPLAKVMRYELRRRDINDLKVVYSTEKAIKPVEGNRIPGSIMAVPASAGLLLAQEVIKDIIEESAK
ncbi:MAG: tRNA threonylcarbamoyladenosine dehydratase [Lachnospiraceae bacterium]|nr:tRNA threonylcarbamoyladenosine dehydratase [Lachnospiraceae bacterium]